MNKITRLTESDLHNMIINAAKRIIKESSDEENYTHFAVNKNTNMIVNGWNYSEYDPTELRQFKRDYFFDDLRDYGLNPKDYTIVTRAYLERQGIDPNDQSNWSNS